MRAVSCRVLFVPICLRHTSLDRLDQLSTKSTLLLSAAPCVGLGPPARLCSPLRVSARLCCLLTVLYALVYSHTPSPRPLQPTRTRPVAPVASAISLDPPRARGGLLLLFGIQHALKRLALL